LLCVYTRVLKANERLTDTLGPSIALVFGNALEKESRVMDAYGRNIHGLTITKKDLRRDLSFIVLMLGSPSWMNFGTILL
jgi:hypothetical protein